ncbi:hypothetical protein ACSBR1_008380 [Camellia fascicularis]
MATFPSFDLVIHYKGKVGRVYNVDPDMYCHVDLLKDIHDSVLSNIGLIEALAIHLYYDIPSTDKRRMLENDLDVLDMFYMQRVSSTINLIDQSVHDGDGDGDVDGDDEYYMDDFFGFSDEDLDWNENVDAENESGSTSSEYVLSQDDGLEPYLNPKGEVVLEKGMIFANVNSFRASLKDYIVETGFKIVRDKNEKSRVTTHCAAEGCPWRIHASSLLDGITYKIKALVP